MRKCMISLFTAIFLAAGAGAVQAAEKAPPKVVDLAHSTLAAFGSDPVIIKAVKAENAKGKSLSQVKEMDKKWTSTPGIADFMKALMDSECGQRLAQIRASAPYYTEIFVMDNLGANVAMTDKTSDYWQGDEAKFQKSFAGGKGAVFVDDVKFDDSTQAYLAQVSVPVKDGKTVIGAITFGLNVERLQ